MNSSCHGFSEGSVLPPQFMESARLCPLSPTCAVSWELSRDSTLEQLQDSSFLFSVSQRSHCPLLPDVRCFGNCHFLYSIHFFGLFGWESKSSYYSILARCVNSMLQNFEPHATGNAETSSNLGNGDQSWVSKRWLCSVWRTDWRRSETGRLSQKPNNRQRVPSEGIYLRNSTILVWKVS